MHGFQSNGTLFLGRTNVQRTHIVQSVRQLDKDDAQVLGHGKEHLAQIADAGLLLGLEGNIQLGNAVHDVRYVGTKLFPYVIQGHSVGAILHGIVQECGADRICIQLALVHNGGHGDGMDDIILPGNTLLAAV